MTLRTSRRGFLSRVALAASALAVAPLRYLVRPEPAWAVIGPGSCSSGLCTDGWTEFCCAINNGHNSCPSWSYMGGWWKCTNYPGSQLCSGQNVRYYVDCNVKPGHSAPGGCHCANGSCSHRRVACNVFRYGQCNTQVPGTTAVGCRVVTCTNPSSIPGFNCNSSYAQENAVCSQESPCLDTAHVRVLGANPAA